MPPGFKYRRTAACLPALLLCASAAFAAAKPAALKPSAIEAIEQAVSAEMARQSIPAISVAVADGGRLEWAQGFGMTDLENSVPATASSAYRLGSISKPITAVAAMQLVERGRLDLDAPIQKYVPSFPEKPWPITARLLLGHLSGIRHYNPGEIASTRHYTNLTEPLKIFAGDPLLFEPGSRYSYTTYGYVLLGAAVEAASGMKFVDYLRENIFGSARMAHIEQDDVFAIVPHRARGYRRNASGKIENCGLADTSNKIPGGGLVSTAGDLIQFATALNAGLLVKKATLAEMFTSQKTRDGKPTSYGLGWSLGERDGKKWVGHTGAQQGTSTLLLMCPSEGLAVAIMTNLEGVNPTALGQRIAQIVLGQ
jgi:CubicO group peptidase (beta-lactamase class C family)